MPPGRNLFKLELAETTLISGLSRQIGITFLSRLEINVMLESFDVLRVVPDCGCRYRCNPNQNVYLSIPFNISLISDFIPSILFSLKSRSERFKMRNPRRATGHAVAGAGAELCSGEQVAALTDHAGKVQHLKLFSKTFQHNLSSQYTVSIVYTKHCQRHNGPEG